MSFDSATVSSEGTDLLLVAGELDLSSCPMVRGAVADAVEARVAATAPPDAGALRLLVLDLSAVTFVASAGLALLVELRALALDHALQLVVVAVPETAPARRLRRTGLDSILLIRASIGAVRRAAHRGETPRCEGESPAATRP